MMLDEWIKAGTKRLNEAGVQTARLDTLILLEDVLGKDRAWLLAHPETQIVPSKMAKLDKLLGRRAQHEPLAYLRGKSEFYGRNFVISQDVLQPRPESETMIGMVKDLIKNRYSGQTVVSIADIGTGSGALGITTALEVKNGQVELIDISEEALIIAKINVDLFTLNIKVLMSDLLKNVQSKYDILLCNLPYVPDDYEINQAAQYEPEVALFGGPDGLDLYRKLFDQINNRTEKPLYILCESLPEQHAVMSKIAIQYGYKLALTSDFIQQFELQK